MPVWVVEAEPISGPVSIGTPSKPICGGLAEVLELELELGLGLGLDAEAELELVVEELPHADRASAMTNPRTIRAGARG